MYAILMCAVAIAYVNMCCQVYSIINVLFFLIALQLCWLCGELLAEIKLKLFHGG